MATATATLNVWTYEVDVHNNTAAAITVSASNVGSTIQTASIPAGESAFVGVIGQRPDVLNQAGHGGFDSNQGLGAGVGQTVQTLAAQGSLAAAITVTATGTVVSATVQADGSVVVA